MRLRPSQVPAEALFIIGALSQYLGAAVAVELFSDLTPGGVALLRVLGAAVVLLVLRRAWRRNWWAQRQQRWSGADWAWAAAFGATLALMNLSIYVSIAELPLGNAVALEFLGPITVAAIGSRTARSLLSVSLALVGVVVLAGLQTDGSVKGVAFALLAGGFWAGYIVLGHRVAHREPSVDGLGIAMLIGAFVISPFGVSELGNAIGNPVVLLLALATGMASNVIPYGIDQSVMRRLNRTRFALLQALLPATAAVVGIVLLAQRPAVSDVVGICLVISAIVLGSHNRRPDTASAAGPL